MAQYIVLIVFGLLFVASAIIAAVGAFSDHNGLFELGQELIKAVLSAILGALVTLGAGRASSRKAPKA